jgi:hypothetical protein
MPSARAADTDAEAEAVQMKLLRQASPARRARLALSLSDTVLMLARRALRRASPGASEREIAIRFVELHYGAPLAEELRRFLASRG